MFQALSSVLSLLIGAGILILGNGLIGILLPIRLSIEHISPETTGLIMSAYYAGFMLGSKYGQVVIQRVGHIRTFAAFAALLTATVMVCALIFNPALWAVLRASIGFCMAALYATIESWLNVRSSNENRGQVLSFYMVTNYLASALGQFLVNARETSGVELFCLAALLTSLSLVPVVMTRVAGPEISGIRPLGLKSLYQASPLGVVATFGAGLLTGAFYALAAVYANRIGLSVFQVSLFVAVPVFAGLILQWPIGRLSDRYDRRTVLLAVLVGAATASLVLSILSVSAAALTPLLLASAVLGSCLATIYPIAVAQAFDYIDRAVMVSANSSMLFIWSIGATAGPLIASFVMGQVGPTGLFFYLTIVAVIIAGFTRYRMSARQALPTSEQSSFVALTTSSAIAGALDPRADPLPEFYYDDVDPGDR
ncbi:MFS transporter [Dongia soli]|uniref:MFS transporter n=1 Tax=Dongia soli TaxID=600628 RepID=A0ABU5EAJ1_9PROT|nr:MFS transporter [Dongia soli]MDY0882891.1 MFS transporter [Dongia soli]